MESITLLSLFGIQIIPWKYIKTSAMRITVTVCPDYKKKTFFWFVLIMRKLLK